MKNMHYNSKTHDFQFCKDKRDTLLMQIKSCRCKKGGKV